MNRFIIFSAGWNSENWIEKHINSIKNQTYKNYIHVVVDDFSDDNTQNILKELSYENLCVHRNERNIRWVHNAITYLDNYITNDEDIIVLVDLDDWLYHNNVLKQLNEIYESENVWLTYGTFIDSTQGSYTQEELKERNFRSIKWKFGHLRTFKAFLWNNINKEDLKYNGDWPPYTYDKAIGFPLLEMCPSNKIRYIPEINYYYNRNNNNKTSNQKQGNGLGSYYRRKKPYEIIYR
jgi:glycosyltransferase involved in cell wall biosynthesis